MDNIPPPPSNQRPGGGARRPAAARGAVHQRGLPALQPARSARPRRPHPILADTAVRRALTLALDRQLLVRAVLGRHGEVPYGPVSSLLWIRHGAPPRRSRRSRGRAAAPRRARLEGQPTATAILDRDGRPLSLTAQSTRTPARSAGRWRCSSSSSGARSACGSSWSSSTAGVERAARGRATSTSTSPTRSRTLRHRGSPRAGRAAAAATSRSTAIRPWTRCWTAAITSPGPTRRPGTPCSAVSRRSAPATFMYALELCLRGAPPLRQRDPRPGSSWSALWQWSVRPGAAGRRRRVLDGRLARAAAGAVGDHLRRRGRAAVRAHAARARRPALAPAGRPADEPRRDRLLRRLYGLDQPLHRQFLAFVRGVGPRRPRHLDRLRAPRRPRSSRAGFPPRCCSAARSSCSTSRSACGSACGRRSGAASASTAGSRRSRSPATPCPRSGSAWCWRGSWGSSCAGFRPAGMADPLLALGRGPAHPCAGRRSPTWSCPRSRSPR